MAPCFGVRQCAVVGQATVSQSKTLHVFTAVTVKERYKLNHTVPQGPVTRGESGKTLVRLRYLENLIGGSAEISEAYAERRMSAIAVIWPWLWTERTSRQTTASVDDTNTPHHV